MIYVTKKMHFSASHRLHNPKLSDERNVEIFDKCNNLNGHGHNYFLEVTVGGDIDSNSGYVIDLKKLKKIIAEEVIDRVDHKNLNLDVDFLNGIIPSVENLIVVFWDRLKNKIPQGKLYKLKLFETESSWVEYYGDISNIN